MRFRRGVGLVSAVSAVPDLDPPPTPVSQPVLLLAESSRVCRGSMWFRWGVGVCCARSAAIRNLTFDVVPLGCWTGVCGVGLVSAVPAVQRLATSAI